MECEGGALVWDFQQNTVAVTDTAGRDLTAVKPPAIRYESWHFMAS